MKCFVDSCNNTDTEGNFAFKTSESDYINELIVEY